MAITGASPLQHFPVPLGTDAPPDIPLAIASLAAAVEQRVVMYFETPAVRDQTFPGGLGQSPLEGMVAYIASTKRLECFDGVSWRPILDVVPPQLHAYVSAPQTLPDRAWQVISFDNEEYDTAGMHSSSAPTRVIAPVTGLYQVNAAVVFSWSQRDYYYYSYSGARALQVRKNANGTVSGGTRVGLRVEDGFARWYWSLYDLPAIPGLGNYHDGCEITMDVRLNAGDYLEVLAFQSSGDNAALGNEKSLTFVQARLVSS